MENFLNGCLNEEVLGSSFGGSYDLHCRL
jgi:hypothetical protein